MDVETLIQILQRIEQEGNDTESQHVDADQALLQFIDDDRVSEAFANIPKWYS